MKTLLAASLSMTMVTLPALASDFASVVLSYTPGSGAIYTDPSRALGAPSMLATPTIPDNSSIVSLGTGGVLVLGFDTPIVNRPPLLGGYDFIVFGNAFYVEGDVGFRFQEPATIEVGIDANRNRLLDAGDPFYRLKNSANAAYSVFGVSSAAYPTWGYADVTPTDGSGDPRLPDDPFTDGIDPGSAGGDAFDLDWAVNAQGNPVHLTQVDFIRIRSAGNWSPDIDAASKTVPRRAFPASRKSGVFSGTVHPIVK